MLRFKTLSWDCGVSCNGTAPTRLNKLLNLHRRNGRAVTALRRKNRDRPPLQKSKRPMTYRMKTATAPRRWHRGFRCSLERASGRNLRSVKLAGEWRSHSMRALWVLLEPITVVVFPWMVVEYTDV